MHAYRRVLSTPGAARFVPFALLARFPTAMIAIGVTLMVQAFYHSYQLAGLVTAAMTVATAIGAPMIGRLIDRFGQRRIGQPMILVFSLCAGSLVTCALLRWPAWALVICAVTTGAVSFPIGALSRSRWSHLLPNPTELQTAFSLESIFDDAAFMFGPSLAALAATTLTPIAGVAMSVIILLIAGFGFLAQRATEPPVLPRFRLRADDDKSADTTGHINQATPDQNSLVNQANSPGQADLSASGANRLAILRPGVAAICLVFVGVGITFGANGITMVAVCEELGAKWASGLILGIGSAASLLGAAVYGARRWFMPLWKRYTICLVMLTVAAALYLVAYTFPTLAVVSFLSGIAISPSFINGNALIQRLVPPHQLTEGLTWIGTTLSVGIAIGSALAGRAIDTWHPHAGYWVLASAAALGLITALASARTLKQRSEPPGVSKLET